MVRVKLFTRGWNSSMPTNYAAEAKPSYIAGAEIVNHAIIEFEATHRHKTVVMVRLKYAQCGGFRD